jgi:hypothetical protein
LSRRIPYGKYRRMAVLRSIALAGAFIALAATAVAQGTGAAMLTQAVAATTAAQAQYAFDVEINTSKINWRARYQPDARPALRLVSPSRENLDGDERRAFDRMAEDFEGVSWCAGARMGNVANVRLLREDETTATYSFQPTRESVRGEQARRYADRMRGEMVMTKGDRPDIARMRIFMPESFSPAPLIRLDHFEMTIACQTAPNGRRYASEAVTEMRGSALGQAFNERTVQRSRNLQ